MQVFDRDGSGLISVDEFKEFLIYLQAHDPKLKETTFDEFVAEADINEEEKVTIEKCCIWVENTLSKFSDSYIIGVSC